MTILILDPVFAGRARQLRGENSRDEVWDGVLVMSPGVNNQHQRLSIRLMTALSAILDPPEMGEVLGPVNVSDRDLGWAENYREPDIAVYLAGNPAIDHDTHWEGGPDLAIEIASPNDRSRDKAAFYAKVGVREFLVIDRDPWRLELHRPAGGTMVLADRVTPESSTAIELDVLPLRLRLVPGAARPAIALVHKGDGRDRRV